MSAAKMAAGSSAAVVNGEEANRNQTLPGSAMAAAGGVASGALACESRSRFVRRRRLTGAPPPTTATRRRLPGWTGGPKRAAPRGAKAPPGYGRGEDG